MGDRKQLHVRVDERDLQELEALAEREGVSVACLVRRLVRTLVRSRPTGQIRSTRPSVETLNGRRIE